MEVLTRPTLNLEHIDASVLNLLMTPGDIPDRLQVNACREAAERLLQRSMSRDPEALEPLQVHQRITQGLPGPSMFQAISLVYDSFDESTAYFQSTAKTMRSWIRRERLGVDDSERVMRLTRVLVMAAQALGDFGEARRYLRTKNFALGGSTPLELMQTAEGERIVLDELQAHAEGGPL